MIRPEGQNRKERAAVPIGEDGREKPPDAVV